ncbi:MAG: hypothetical protein AAFX86_12910 [Pseudomonadota bacterium]
MAFVWPDDARIAFGHAPVIGRHALHEGELATDDGLIALLDAYPREHMGVYTFPPHAEGRVKARHGRAMDISGEDLLNAVKAGQIWLNMRAVNRAVPAYYHLADTIFDPFETATGQRTLKHDVGVLISSPGIHVHYHLDIPLVCLVQLRGTKTLNLYPPRAPFAEPDQIEAVALREREEDITYKTAFESDVQTFELQPGEAITWPQNAPHRVQNGHMMNVSLSCEFMTPAALLRANAIYTNGVLRRSLNLSPRYPAAMGPGLVGRAVLARGLKAVRRKETAPVTPITFELDAKTGRVVDLETAAQ